MICENCKTECEQDSAFCDQCGHKVDPIPLKSEAERIGLDSKSEMIGAGFGIRAVARIVDVIFGLIIGLAVGITSVIVIAALAHNGVITSDWQEAIRTKDQLPAMFLSLIGSILYHSFSEGIGGASVGKALCRLRVVTTEGSPCTLLRAIKRSVAFLVDMLFFGLVGFLSMRTSPSNQRYGDKWAETVVVRKGTSIINGNSGSLFIGVLVGAIVWAAFLALPTFMKIL